MEIQINYLLLKLFHIIGSIIFVGNIMVTAFWKIMADRTRDPKIAAFGQRLVNLTDFAFTSIGAFMIIITGLMMAESYGESVWDVAWIGWGVGFFLISGLLWALVLFPVQVKQAWMAREFSEDSEIPDRYWRLGKIWITCGAVATLLPMINIYFMVFKPN